MAAAGPGVAAPPQPAGLTWPAAAASALVQALAPARQGQGVGRWSRLHRRRRRRVGAAGVTARGTCGLPPRSTCTQAHQRTALPSATAPNNRRRGVAQAARSRFAANIITAPAYVCIVTCMPRYCCRLYNHQPRRGGAASVPPLTSDVAVYGSTPFQVRAANEQQTEPTHKVKAAPHAHGVAMASLRRHPPRTLSQSTCYLKRHWGGSP